MQKQAHDQLTLKQEKKLEMCGQHTTTYYLSTCNFDLDLLLIESNFLAEQRKSIFEKLGFSEWHLYIFSKYFNIWKKIEFDLVS